MPILTLEQLRAIMRPVKHKARIRKRRPRKPEPWFHQTVVMGQKKTRPRYHRSHYDE